MRLAIFSTAAEQIRAHARRDHPREACGLLLGRAGCIETAVPAANVADRADREFEIDPAALLRAHREAREGGRALLGWYHSHPNGRAAPSAMDAERAVEPGRVWVIAAGDALRAFQVVEGGRGRFEPLALEVVTDGDAATG